MGLLLKNLGTEIKERDLYLVFGFFRHVAVHLSNLQAVVIEEALKLLAENLRMSFPALSCISKLFQGLKIFQNEKNTSK